MRLLAHMSRQQQSHPHEHVTDDKGQPPPRAQELPAVAMVRQMLASGNPDANAIAELVVAHPRAAHEIFTLLHRTLGNAFAGQVSSLAASHGGLGEARDVVSFDQSSDYQESRATIDGPPKATAPDTSGDYQESRATIDHPHTTAKADPPWVERARAFNRARPDNVRAFLDSTGKSCVDQATGEPDPQKVARWQADHGLSPDGRIGDQTVQTAVSDPSLAL